jgi:endonuclease/exonuclease/phosphatase family metal-dependent hydrolase
MELETDSFCDSLLPGECPESLRVVSWNINRGLQIDSVIEFLARSSADLILLQETDVNARRTGRRHIPRLIAQALRMNYIFGREFEELAQGAPNSPAVHGQATLSHLPLANPRILRFRSQSQFWRPRWFIPPLSILQRRRGARMALVCDSTIHGQTLVVYNAHLESRGDDELRTVQFSEMLTGIRQDSADTPVLVAGDFNFDLSRGRAATLIADSQLDNPFAELGSRCSTRNRTYGQHTAIDWILTGNGLVASQPEIQNSPGASDHDPISLQIRLA